MPRISGPGMYEDGSSWLYLVTGNGEVYALDRSDPNKGYVQAKGTALDAILKSEDMQFRHPHDWNELKPVAEKVIEAREEDAEGQTTDVMAESDNSAEAEMARRTGESKQEPPKEVVPSAKGAQEALAKLPSHADQVIARQALDNPPDGPPNKDFIGVAWDRVTRGVSKAADGLANVPQKLGDAADRMSKEMAPKAPVGPVGERPKDAEDDGDGMEDFKASLLNLMDEYLGSIKRGNKVAKKEAPSSTSVK